MCFRYTDVLDVIQAITAHPDPQVHSQVTVGAVSACVNPLTSFIKHRQEYFHIHIVNAVIRIICHYAIIIQVTKEPVNTL